MIDTKQIKRYALENTYPNFSPEEITEAKETIDQYVKLVWRIYSRLRLENPKKLTKILLNGRFKRLRR
jgi:hypothetical protein